MIDIRNIKEPTAIYEGIGGLIAIFGSGAFLTIGIVILIILIKRDENENRA